MRKSSPIGAITNPKIPHTVQPNFFIAVFSLCRNQYIRVKSFSLKNTLTPPYPYFHSLNTIPTIGFPPSEFHRTIHKGYMPFAESDNAPAAHYTAQFSGKTVQTGQTKKNAADGTKPHLQRYMKA